MPNRGPRKRHDPKLHRKPSGHYYAVFYDPDRAHRKRLWYSSGITDAQAAQEWFTDICRDWRRGMLDPWSQKQQRERGLGEAINCYFKAHPNLKPTTVVTRVSQLSSFTLHLPAGVTLSLVNEEHITSFLGRPDLVLETRHGYLSILRYFFSWCIKEQLLEADPTSSVKLPKLGRRIPEFLTPMEFRRLLAAVDAIYEEKLNRKPRSYIQEGDILWVKAPIELAVATGLRISDVVRLRWAQVRRDPASSSSTTARRPATNTPYPYSNWPRKCSRGKRKSAMKTVSCFTPLRVGRSRKATSRIGSGRRAPTPGFRRTSASTRSATPSPRGGSCRQAISASSRSCWDTPRSTRRRTTPTSHSWPCVR